VARKSVEVGQRLQVGQPLLAVVDDNVWIVANFKETQLEKMRDKQPVEIKIDSFPNHAFRGHIDSLAPGSGNEFALLPPDNATGNFTKIVQRVPVKIVFEPDSVRGYENLLSPGLSAVVTVTTTRER
jgi:membrane fusion protein (multidrug efflux system)